MEILFWVALFFIFYAYFGYPLALFVLSLLGNRAVKKGVGSPAVSFIITAFNEESRITSKIENTLELDYPSDKFEIIIASDCSDDGTDEIVKCYEYRGVKLVRAPERKGKENAQKHAIEQASGDILVFSDVATILKKDAIANIVGNFDDQTVGCVSSIDKFIDSDGKVSGEGAYVRYEMFLRRLESRVNSLVGLSGSFFAARKAVCSAWATDLPSDFNTLLNSVKTGLRGVLDPDSAGYYNNISDETKEYGRKVRTVLRGISTFMKNLGLLNPFRYRLFAWQIFSHKFCRWLVPFAMLLTLTTNLMIVCFLPFSELYYVSLILQTVFYALAITGIVFYSGKVYLKIPAFFVLVNISILNAWYLYFTGSSIVTWTPSDRTQHDNVVD
jgi:glycosyltransferase involved in cell wall biosynthesis